jgi:hypothetical protein
MILSQLGEFIGLEGLPHSIQILDIFRLIVFGSIHDRIHCPADRFFLNFESVKWKEK